MRRVGENLFYVRLMSSSKILDSDLLKDEKTDGNSTKKDKVSDLSLTYIPQKEDLEHIIAVSENLSRVESPSRKDTESIYFKII